MVAYSYHSEFTKDFTKKISKVNRYLYENVRQKIILKPTVKLKKTEMKATRKQHPKAKKKCKRKTKVKLERGHS